MSTWIYRRHFVGSLLLAALQIASAGYSADVAVIPPSFSTDHSGLGRRPDSLFSREYAALLWDDTRGILSSPLHWKQDDWLLAGSLTTATAGAAIFDGNIRREAQADRNRDNDAFFTEWQKFGAEYSYAILAGFEVWGVMGDNPKARAVAMDGWTASFIATGLVSPALKYSIGRVRPSATAHTFSFKPFSGNSSFPSGHVTQVFAVATIFAHHYDAWWQQSFAYGTAALVGWGRIQQNRHYASDVVAGAAIGWVVGRAVVRRHDAKSVHAAKWQPIPWLDRGRAGLMFERNF